MIHAAPPVAISVPPPPLPPPQALPQTPPVIQHQGAYETTAPIPTYSTNLHHNTTSSTTPASATYGVPYSHTGPHRYTGYASNRYATYWEG